jgi:serine/threonine protein kinase/tetratricopeptide (TPR) repeat protein
VTLVGTRVGHILVERQIGRGGMGEVFLGHDEVLQRRVAVKVLRAEQRLSADSRARFLREARLLSRLDHPGICRVHDVITGVEADFLVLEYVEGQTLRRLDIAAMPLDTRLRVAEKIANALAAAHRERIVHRDLKPENVMVTTGGHVKVLDFGIARSLSAAEPRPAPEQPVAAPTAAGLMEAAGDTAPVTAGMTGSAECGDDGASQLAFRTATGHVAGTLGYMSPEQARGAGFSEASDMYAFGVILHEVATGAPAYGEALGADLIVRVAAAQTEPITGLDPDLVALIHGLESLDPVSRPTAEAAAERLRTILDKPQRARRLRTRVAAATASALLLAAAVLVTYSLSRPAPLFAPDQPRRVALLPCVNDTGTASLDWVERGLIEMVATTLDEVELVEVVPLADVVRAIAESGKKGGEALEASEALRLARMVGAQLVVATTLQRDGAGYALAYTTLNVNGSRGDRSVSASDPVEAARALGARLAPRLNPAAAFVDLADRFSESPYVNRLYATGVQRLRTLGAKEAVRYFEVCLDNEADFAWARLQLAASYEQIDRRDDAAVLIERVRADAVAQGQPRIEAASLDLLALLRYHRGETDEAYRLGERSLALHRSAGDRAGEALTLFRLGDARRSQQRWEECERLYRASLEVRRSIDDRLGEAHSLHGLGVIAAERGRNEEGERLLDAALRLERELGLRRLQAMTLNSLGIMAFRRRDYAAAEERLNESMRIHRDLGSEQSVAFALANLGDVARAQGRLDRALALTHEAYDIALRADEKESCAFRAFNLALILTALHRPDEAQPFLAEARSWFGEDADILTLSASLAAEKGRFAEAYSLQRRAKALAGDAWSEEQERDLSGYRRHAAPERSGGA